MKIYTNENGDIKAVHTSTDTSLIEHEIADEANPFAGWSDDRICCYRVHVQGDRVTMMTPYIDSRFIDHFDMGGKQHSDNSEGIFDLAELAGFNSEAAYDLAEMISFLEERIEALERKVG